MAAILCDSAVIVIVFVRMHPRAVSLAMITMRKSMHGFPFLSYSCMGLRLAAFGTAGAPLKPMGANLAISFSSFSDVLYFVSCHQI